MDSLMYTYIYIYIYMCVYIYIYIYIIWRYDRRTPHAKRACSYTWFPLEDSRLFGPSPWKILAATIEQDIWATQPLANILQAGILL